MLAVAVGVLEDQDAIAAFALGLVVLGTLLLPWFLAIMGRAGNTFLAESVGRDLLGKIISPQEAQASRYGW